MNHITIELCAEDRARLDRLAELLEKQLPPTVHMNLGAPKQEAPQDMTPEAVTNEVQAVVDVPAAEPTPEPKPAPVEKPKTTHADVMAMLQPMLAPGSKKRATAREIVLAYAPKVSAIPADKLDEVLGRLQALADDEEG